MESWGYPKPKRRREKVHFDKKKSSMSKGKRAKAVFAVGGNGHKKKGADIG